MSCLTLTPPPPLADFFSKLLPDMSFSKSMGNTFMAHGATLLTFSSLVSEDFWVSLGFPSDQSVSANPEILTKDQQGTLSMVSLLMCKVSESCSIFPGLAAFSPKLLEIKICLSQDRFSSHPSSLLICHLELAQRANLSKET